jgi:thioredoxin-related protein
MKMLALLSLALVTSTAAFAAAGWDDDYEKALAQAKAEKKMVVLDFTGSDWCGWCIKLDKEVFSKKEFKDYAKDNLVLVEVDFRKRSACRRKPWSKTRNFRKSTDSRLPNHHRARFRGQEGWATGVHGRRTSAVHREARRG